MAEAVVPKERWFRLRIVVSGLRATVFVDDLEKPALVVPHLKREPASGGIGLWAGGGGAWFSGVRFEPSPSSAAVSAPPVSLSPGVIKTWELSPAADAEDALPEALPAVPRWDRVPVESPGVLVIDRYRKNAGVLPPAFDFKNRLGKAKGRRIVYARAVVESSREQVKRLSFGYSDEVCVFLNGRILFSGRSAFRFRDPGFMGVVDVENDAVYLPLRRGENEIVMAVAEYFGGWGLIARFDDPSGLVLP
jgi:hypothetical protein